MSAINYKCLYLAALIFGCLSEGKREEDLNLIDWENPQELHVLGEQAPARERLPVNIDSGAVDTVGPKEVGRAFKLRETRASKEGKNYVAANGSKIQNY